MLGAGGAVVVGLAGAGAAFDVGAAGVVTAGFAVVEPAVVGFPVVDTVARLPAEGRPGFAVAGEVAPDFAVTEVTALVVAAGLLAAALLAAGLLAAVGLLPVVALLAEPDTRAPLTGAALDAGAEIEAPEDCVPPDSAAPALLTVERVAKTPVSVGAADWLTAAAPAAPLGTAPFDRPATTKITPTNTAISTTMKIMRRSQ